jgi:hypothetical protein
MFGLFLNYIYLYLPMTYNIEAYMHIYTINNSSDYDTYKFNKTLSDHVIEIHEISAEFFYLTYPNFF